MLKKIEERARRAIEEQLFPGCVIGAMRDGERTVCAFGTLRHGGDAAAEDTIYDAASVTKSIPLAALAALLAGEGKIALQDKVAAHIPELKNHFDATIEDLLRYRVHGMPLSTLAHLDATRLKERIMERGFLEPPGEPRYSNLPAFLLGIVVERAAGKGLEALGSEYIFSPLAMTRTSFAPQSVATDRAIYRYIAPTEIVNGEEVCGIVHDESARVFAREGSACGHAGLFSSAPDLLNFFGALIAGEFPEVSAFAERGLGWQLADGRFMGEYCGAKTFGKTGFTGTSVLCDRERGAALVVLSNRTFPTRPADDSAIYAFRRDIADIVLRTP